LFNDDSLIAKSEIGSDANPSRLGLSLLINTSNGQAVGSTTMENAPRYFDLHNSFMEATILIYIATSSDLRRRAGSITEGASSIRQNCPTMRGRARSQV
jgi:hypothetical protein